MQMDQLLVSIKSPLEALMFEYSVLCGTCFTVLVRFEQLTFISVILHEETSPARISH